MMGSWRKTISDSTCANGKNADPLFFESVGPETYLGDTMRFKSEKKMDFQFCGFGGHTPLFGLQATAAAKQGLLGLRSNGLIPRKMSAISCGLQGVPQRDPHPNQDTHVGTFEHPVQSLLDDFTGKPGARIRVLLYPIRGEPRIWTKRRAIRIKVRTEPYQSFGA